MLLRYSLRRIANVHAQSVRVLSAGMVKPVDMTALVKTCVGEASRLHSAILERSRGFEDDPSAVQRLLSPSVLNSMIEEALAQSDQQSLHMLLAQALTAKSIAAVEKILGHFTITQQFGAAAEMVAFCTAQSLALSPAVPLALATNSARDAHWVHAHSSLAHMLSNGMVFPAQLLASTFSALLTDQRHGLLAIELLHLVAQHNRKDLADCIDLSALQMHSRSLGGKQLVLPDAARRLLQQTMAHMTKASSSWLSLPLVEAVTALGSAASQEDAVAFARELLAACAPAERLPLLQALAAGDVTAVRYLARADGLRDKDFSPLTSALVDLALSAGATGLAAQMDLVALYLPLAYRLRGAEHSTEVQRVFDELSAFYQDKSSATLSIDMHSAGGAHRRLIRQLSDSMDLACKIQHQPQPLCTISKHPRSLPALDASFSAFLLRTDKRGVNMSQLDGLPAQWEKARAMLMQMDDLGLQMVTERAALALHHNPSTAWMLLLIDLLQDKGVPLPRGTLRAALRMATKRRDIFGIVEVLQAALVEQTASRSTSYQSKLHHLHEKRRWSSPMDWMCASPEVQCDDLQQQDWDLALTSALHRRGPLHELSQQAFKDSYLEMLGIMRRYGMDLSQSTARALLRFLVLHMNKSRHIRAMLLRLKDDPKHELQPAECAIISTRLLQTNGLCNAFQVAPLYIERNDYLRLAPGGLDLLFRQSMEAMTVDERAVFQLVWPKALENRSGREQLVVFLESCISSKSAAQGQEAKHRLRAVSNLAIFSAYLSSLYDGQHRKAYCLLLPLSAEPVDAAEQ